MSRFSRPIESLPEPWLVGVCRTVAALLPVFLALTTVTSEARWGQDVAVVRALGQAHVGAEGVISAVLGGAAQLIPLGSRVLRAALVNVLVAGLLSGLLFELCLSQLSGGRRPASRHAVLALGGVLVAGVSPSFQSATVAVGGPLIGTCLILLSLRVGLRRTSDWWLHGVLFGLASVEERMAAGALLLSLLIRLTYSFYLPSPRQLLLGVLAIVGVFGVGILPELLEPFSKTPNLSFGWALNLPTSSHAPQVLSWGKELGVYGVGLAVLGILALVWCRSQRALSAVMLGLFVADALLSHPTLRLAAVLGAAVFMAQGGFLIVLTLQRGQLPFGVAAQRLLAVLHLGAILMGAEQSRQVQARNSISAADTWSWEAFEQLPPETLLLVSSPEAAWRLWSARVTHGTRPDVLMVPSHLLSHGNLAERLLTAEPQLAPVIRDIAITGRPSEFALSQLADTRPLRVELGADWDRRLMAHLAPAGLWFEFAPHALGRSDRDQGLASLRRAARHVLENARSERGTDWSTLRRLHDDLERHATVMETLGDTSTALRLARTMRDLDPESQLAKQLHLRLQENSLSRR